MDNRPRRTQPVKRPRYRLGQRRKPTEDLSLAYSLIYLVFLVRRFASFDVDQNLTANPQRVYKKMIRFLQENGTLNSCPQAFPIPKSPSPPLNCGFLSPSPIGWRSVSRRISPCCWWARSATARSAGVKQPSCLGTPTKRLNRAGRWRKI